MPAYPSLIRRLVTAAAIALVGGSTALVATPADATTGSGHPGRGARYVALGDSFASGEGLAPYEAGTDTATDRCHRSVRQSYPELLERSRIRAFDNLTSVACSGAVTTSMFATVPDRANEPPQLNALTRSTKTVTVSIGGNDAGFSEVLKSCIYSPVADPKVQAAIAGRPGCRGRLDALVSARIANLASSTGNPAFAPTVPLPQVIAAIHARAPRATIYVSSNPQLFGTTFTSPYGCAVGNLGPVPLAVTADDAQWIRSKATDLAAATRASVAKARAAGIPARFVDVQAQFSGHNLCDTQTPWLNPVTFTATTPPQPQPSTLHPTARGQQTYAEAFARAAVRHHRWDGSGWNGNRWAD